MSQSDNQSPKRISHHKAVMCPCGGLTEVRCLALKMGLFEWCQRSGLVCRVDEFTETCPLDHSLSPTSAAAEWACPRQKSARRAPDDK